jgi:hypothetical protein
VIWYKVLYVTNLAFFQYKHFNGQIWKIAKCLKRICSWKSKLTLEQQKCWLYFCCDFTFVISLKSIITYSKISDMRIIEHLLLIIAKLQCLLYTEQKVWILFSVCW